MKKFVSILLAFVMIITVTSCANTAQSSWQKHLDLGQKYLLDGDYEQAIIEFNKVIEIEPKNVDAYLGLAEAYVAAGDYDSAISVLEQGYAETENPALQDRINELRGLAAEQTEAATTTAPETTAPITTTVPETTTEATTTEPEPEPVAEDFSWSIEGDVLTFRGHGRMPDFKSGWLYDYVSSHETGGITHIIVDDGLTYIGTSAFSGCSSCKSIELSDSVKDTGEFAFSFGGSNDLESITVSPNNQYLCSQDGVLFTKDMKTLVKYPSGKADANYNIPESVTEIGDDAFADCNAFTDFTIPEGVEKIGWRNFQYCDNLVNVTLPSTLKSFHSTDFTLCQNLEKISVSENNANFCSVDGVLFTKDMSKLIRYPANKSGSSYEIPDGVKVIGHWAFEGCDNLTSVIFPDSVTTIEPGAFGGCDNLTSINYPEDVVFDWYYED